MRTTSGGKRFCLAATTTGFFSWDDWKITNEDIKSEIDDMLETFKRNTTNKSSTSTENSSEAIKINFEYSRTIERDNEWRKVYDKKDLIIWRRKLLINEQNTLVIPVQDNNNNTNGSDHQEKSSSNNSNSDSAESMHEIFEYKVLGRLNDVTPLEFFHTQVDLDFRKEWDYLVIQIESLDKEETTNTEVIKWLMKFPYPLYPREYVFVRRCCLEPNQKVLVVVSKSLPDIKLPDQKDMLKHNQSHQSQHEPHHQHHSQQQHQGNVRVTSYKSNMIILPHSEFDEKGLDYVIQYYDDSKARIPKLAYKWVTASGLPDYTEKLHKATLRAKVHQSTSNIFKCCAPKSSTSTTSTTTTTTPNQPKAGTNSNQP